MQMVTSFEDGSDERDILVEYDQIFQALAHNPEVAENVFARVAKALKLRVGDAHFKEAKDARGMIPMWVTEASVVLVEPVPKSDFKEWRFALDSLVECVSQHLNYSVSNHDYVLVDPLSTHIQQVGERLYRFIIKQKWALEASNG